MNRDGNVGEDDLETIIARIFEGSSGRLDIDATAVDVLFVVGEIAATAP